MTIQKRKEIEVKIWLGKQFKSLEEYREIVNNIGFAYQQSRLETDYLPDTLDDACKRNGLLLRFRCIQTRDSTTWLLTLKKRAPTVGVIDYEEIETDFTNPDTETFEYINKLLSNAAGYGLDAAVLHSHSLEELRNSVRSCGFSKNRIILDKYREEFGKSRDHITLDFFPDDMGVYMEIESYTRSELDVIIRQLNLSSNDIITTDYGDLLKQHKRNHSLADQRLSLFDSVTRIKLLGV